MCKLYGVELKTVHMNITNVTQGCRFQKYLKVLAFSVILHIKDN